MKILIVPAFLVSIFVAAACFGQTAQPTEQPTLASQPAKAAERSYVTITRSGDETEDYRLKPGDVIDIKVEKAPELSGPYSLNTNGSFIFPVVGQINADKKTPEEVSQFIAGRLRGSYLTNPIVAVSIKEQSKKPVYPFSIQGAVHGGKTFELEKSPSLLEFISMAGGLDDSHGPTAFISRKKAEEVKSTTENADAQADVNYDLILVNINRLYKGEYQQNIKMMPGDVVFIPKADIFYVAGEVKAPGSFTLKEGTTLRQAIALAQNVNFQAAGERGVIFREDSYGKRTEVAVDISAIMAGKKPDIEIKPNDIIMVPNSKMKSVASSVMRAASGSLIRAIIGF